MAINDPWYALQAQESLDPSWLVLDAAEAAFFKAQTGIDDDDALREHILAVQRKAFSVWPYPCIRRFVFTKLKISRFAVYDEVLKLGRERPGAILLDLGCCFGNDARKAVADGFPMSQVIASDLRSEFWDLGHELFRDNAETCTLRFVQGDVFSDGFVDPTSETSTTSDDDVLSRCVSQASLNPLRGRVSAVHASAFFHLFNAAQQRQLAIRCAALLSAEPGSVIFGSHSGAVIAGSRPDRDTYAHSPESWRQLWADVVPNGGVEVDAEFVENVHTEGGTALDRVVNASDNSSSRGGWLIWTVRRK